MTHNYDRDCAICNCWHTKKIFFEGKWHDWVAPSQQQVAKRKNQKRSRRKTSW